MSEVQPLWQVVESQLYLKYAMRPTEERRRVLLEIGSYVEALIAHELLKLNEKRDTIPSPPIGDSHSGAIVVPRGSSKPPHPGDCVACQDSGIGCDLHGWVCCKHCGMVACVCVGFPTDGSNGEGGP